VFRRERDHYQTDPIRIDHIQRREQETFFIAFVKILETNDGLPEETAKVWAKSTKHLT
jgi:hypothetical protein